ncbi:MAG TPA: glycosyltransferase family 1 protein [Acidothermaceae bacterium]
MTKASCIAVVDAGGDDWTAGGQVSRMMARSISACAAASDRSVLFVSRRVQAGDATLTELGIEVVDLAPSSAKSGQSRSWGESRSATDRKIRRALSLPDAIDPLAYLRTRKPDAVLPLMSAPLRPRLAGSVGWIADFQHRAMPEFFSAAERADRDRTYAKVAARCHVVLVSSDAMAEQFRAIYPMQSSKLRVLPFPSALAFATAASDASGDANGDANTDADAVRSLYHLPPRFVLVANQFWQHKNHGLVVDAVAEASNAGVAIPVVMTGLPADNRDPANRYVSDLLQRIAKAGLSGQVIVLGQVPYAHFIALMRSASLLLQPSRYEGWNTSIEDAKALGTPLLCSDIPVHREQAAEFGACFFDVESAGSLAKMLQSMWASAQAPSPKATQAAQERARERTEIYGVGLLDACDTAASI